MTIPHSPALPRDRPLVTVDLVVFTVADDALQVLLVRRPDRPGEPFPGQWALPGGFVDVDADEDLEACARRKLADKTGVRSPYLEQLGAFGSRDRDPRVWSVTQVYFALLPASAADTPDVRAGTTESRWWPVSSRGVGTRLAFDHGRLLVAALERLRSKVEYTSLPAFLVPAEFTLTELQRAYEVVLDRPLEKSAFRRRMLAAELVEPVDKQRDTGKRPAQLYRLARRSTAVFFPRTFSPRD